MKHLTTIALLAASATCHAAEQPKTTTVDFSLYSSVIATRTADYVSTEQLLSHGGRELLLPSALVSNKPAFAAFELGSGAAEIWAARKLSVHHPKLARVMLAADAIAAGIIAAHNEAVVPSRRVK